MKALVTGAAGFIGRHMTAALRVRGYRVARCDSVLAWDALDLFREHDQHYDLVVHAAARSPHRAAIDSQPATHIYNQHLDAAMFEWAQRTGQSRVLYLSSCAALDEVPDDYGALKLCGERMARQARAAGLPVTVVRPYSEYGEDQGTDWPFGAFIERARRRDDPFEIWGDGTQVRDWIHVDDVIGAALAVVASDTEEPVSLCTGVGTSMLELARMTAALAGYEPEFKTLPDKPAGVAYRVGDPGRMLRYYAPTVGLEEGVKRALAG